MTTEATSSTDVTTTRRDQQVTRGTGIGVALALTSAAAFATSGPFGKALFTGGWTPLAAVTWRIGLAALALLIPTLLAMRGRWHLLRHNLGTIAVSGVLGVAGCQLFYFVAVDHLSVGVALMLEYLSPILLVLLAWATTRRAPRRRTAIGTVAALVGLALVLDVLGGVRLDGVGVLFGLAAAVCSASYFLVVSRQHDHSLPPLALAGLSMIAGVVPLLVVRAVGLLPWRTTTDQVVFVGHHVSYVVPLVGISLLAAAFAYVSGIAGARRLGSRMASFLALAEVLFAVLFAWVLLGELPLPIQLLGGVLIVAGVVLVRLDERDPVDAPPGELDMADTSAARDPEQVLAD